MKNFFSNLRTRMELWMSGRYGYDELSIAASIVALVGLVLSYLPHLRFLYVPVLLLLVWTLFRCYSKQIEKRQAERMAYLRFSGTVRAYFETAGKAWKERKTHRYYRCKQCHTVLRVPKGKGKLKITCPQCHRETVKKT